MSSKSKGKKQVHKGTAEIVKDAANDKEVRRQRALAKDVLYEYLIKNSNSIEDAKNMCYATVIGIQQAFHNKIAQEQKQLSAQKLSTLDMTSQMVQEGDVERFKGFVALLEEETITTADALLTGLKQVIESFEREEASKRSLDTLKATFLE